MSQYFLERHDQWNTDSYVDDIEKALVLHRHVRGNALV